jgi:hypothetical protein
MLISSLGVANPTDAQMFTVTGWASGTDQKEEKPMQTRQVAARSDRVAARLVQQAEPRFVVTGVVSLAQLKEQVELLEKARRGEIRGMADSALFSQPEAAPAGAQSA